MKRQLVAMEESRNVCLSCRDCPAARSDLVGFFYETSTGQPLTRPSLRAPRFTLERASPRFAPLHGDVTSGDLGVH